MRILLAILMVLCLCGEGWAATYYVRSTGDGSDGSTEAKAYQTIQACFDAVNLASGDIVDIGAETYREMVTWGADDGGATLKGQGPSSIITAFNIVAPASWTHSSGTVGGTDEIFSYDGGQVMNYMLVDGVSPQRCPNGSNTTPEDGRWGKNGNLIYWNPPGATQPAAYVTEALIRNNCIFVDTIDNVTISDMTCIGANLVSPNGDEWDRAAVALINGTGMTAKNLIVKWGWNAGIIMSSVITGVIDNCDVMGSNAYGICARDACNGVTISNSRSHHNGYMRDYVTTPPDCEGIVVAGYDSVGTYPNNVSITNCEGDNNGCLVSNSHLGRGCNIYGAPTNITVKNSRWHDNTGVGLICQLTENDGATVTLTNNLFYNNCGNAAVAGTYRAGLVLQTWKDCAVTMYNNIILGTSEPQAATSADFHILTSTNGKTFTLTMKNNIIYASELTNPVDYAIRWTQTAGSVLTYVGDNNCVYDPSTTNICRWSGVDKTLAQWQTATSQDASSLSSDPLVLSSYKLRGGSPCIDAGANGLVTTDFSGAVRPKHGTCDIGAYEYNPVMRLRMLQP